MLKARSPAVRGFTLVEVAVALSIFALLVAAAVPAMTRWVIGAKLRTAADALQNGLRLAQTESLRRSRQVVFSLTNSSTPQNSLTAAANGQYWSINTIASLSGESGQFIESGTLATTTSGVSIAGQAEICFNSMGRLVTNSSTNITGGSCSAPTGNPPAYKYVLTDTSSARQLEVDVLLGGQIHVCDPTKTLSATVPDGC